MLVALELDMGTLKKELKQSQGEGKLTRGINVFTDIADWAADLVESGEAESVAQLVDPLLRGPLKAMHEARGKKAEQLRKLKAELKAAKKSATPKA